MGHNSKNRHRHHHAAKNARCIPAIPLGPHKPHMHQAEDEHCFPGRSLEEVKAEVASSPNFRLGQFVTAEDLPYLGKRVDVQVEMGQDGPIVREFFEPVPPREAVAYIFPKKVHATEQEQDLYEVKRVAFLLRQEAWYEGLLPEEQWIYCEACLDTRSAYGANRYDVHLVCNQCVEDFESNLVLDKVRSFDQWFELTAALNHWNRFIGSVSHKK